MTISIRTETYEVAATKDRWGDAVTNSAGDPIVRTKKMSRLIFHYSRYMKKWDWDNNEYALTQPEYVFVDPADINSDIKGITNTGGFVHSRNWDGSWVPTGPFRKWMGSLVVGKGKAKIESIQSDFAYDFGGCVKVDIEVKIDPLWHYDKFLDQGFFHLNTPGVTQAGGITLADYLAGSLDEGPAALTPLPSTPGSTAPSIARRQFRDRHGFPATTPQLLDGFGNPLGENMPPQELNRQYYQFRDWEVPPLGGPGGFFT